MRNPSARRLLTRAKSIRSASLTREISDHNPELREALNRSTDHDRHTRESHPRRRAADVGGPPRAVAGARPALRPAREKRARQQQSSTQHAAPRHPRPEEKKKTPATTTPSAPASTTSSS